MLFYNINKFKYCCKKWKILILKTKIKKIVFNTVKKTPTAHPWSVIEKIIINSNAHSNFNQELFIRAYQIKMYMIIYGPLIEHSFSKKILRKMNC